MKAIQFRITRYNFHQFYKKVRNINISTFLLSVFILLSLNLASSQTITEIIDANGDDNGNTLDIPTGVAVDGSGNVYVADRNDKVFKITPGGDISVIIDADGDGNGNTLNGPEHVAVGSNGNVYVTGYWSDNAFEIAGGIITEIIDATGDGEGNTLNGAAGIAVKGTIVYITGTSSKNAFSIDGETITEIIDATGDGNGNTLSSPEGIAVDGSGNVYVAGIGSNNAFKITPSSTITEIIDATGDGNGNTLSQPRGLAADASGNVYVPGGSSQNAFKITPGGNITEIIDSDGDGNGNTLNTPRRIAVDASQTVYLTSGSYNRTFEITSGGDISVIIDSDGDGNGNTLGLAFGVAVDNADNVYVTGQNSDNAFKIELGPLPVELVQFNAQAKESSVLLSWQTASEQNNEGFFIERSEDGADWEQLGFVNGFGNSSQNRQYKFLDEFPLQGSTYYRLKQLDRDGGTKSSPIISVNFEPIFESELTIFPNPVHHEHVFLQLKSAQSGIGKVQIFNSHGSIAKQIDVKLESGLKNYLVYLDQLPSGIYFVKIDTRSKILIEKIFVTKGK